MDVYDVDLYVFWDKENEGNIETFSVAAEDGEKALTKAKKIALAQSWTEESNIINTKKKEIVHKVDSVVLHQIVYKQALDG